MQMQSHFPNEYVDWGKLKQALTKTEESLYGMDNTAKTVLPLAWGTPKEELHKFPLLNIEYAGQLTEKRWKMRDIAKLVIGVHNVILKNAMVAPNPPLCPKYPAALFLFILCFMIQEPKKGNAGVS